MSRSAKARASADARTLFVNQRTARMLGYGTDEMLGRRIVDFMDETSRAAAEGTIIQRLRTASEQFEVLIANLRHNMALDIHLSVFRSVPRSLYGPIRSPATYEPPA